MDKASTKLNWAMREAAPAMALFPPLTWPAFLSYLVWELYHFFKT